jgi:hypothetical protein
VPQHPVSLGDSLGAQSLQLGILFFAADVCALAEVGVGEPVRNAGLDELPRRKAGTVQRLALETGLREDFFGIGSRAALDDGAPGEHDGEKQRRVFHDRFLQGVVDALIVRRVRVRAVAKLVTGVAVANMSADIRRHAAFTFARPAGRSMRSL